MNPESVFLQHILVTIMACMGVTMFGSAIWSWVELVRLAWYLDEHHPKNAKERTDGSMFATVTPRFARGTGNMPWFYAFILDNESCGDPDLLSRKKKVRRLWILAFASLMTLNLIALIGDFFLLWG